MMSRRQHPDGDSLVSLIERCLHFQADYGNVMAPTLDKESLLARQQARRAELAQAVKIAALCINDSKLPIYHRGLGARLLACALSQTAGSGLAEKAQQCSVHLLDIMNQSSSGITREHGPVRISPVDRHRIGVNCAAALAQLHAAVSTGGSARVHGSVQHLDTDIMKMAPHPEKFSIEEADALDEQLRLMADSIERSRQGTGFWTDIGRSGRGNANPRGSMSGYSSHYSFSAQTDGLSDGEGDFVPPNTASTGASSTFLDPRDFYRQSKPPTHRPTTQYSALAGSMGLYDPDVREEMRVLKARHDRENGSEERTSQREPSDQILDIETEAENGGRKGVFESLEEGIGLDTGYSPPSSPSPSQKARRRLRSRAYRRSKRGGGKSMHNNNIPQGSSTYTEFIRVMLSTPMQGPASRSLKHRHPAQDDPSHPLNELAHSVRRNWTCMPEYLEALGVLSTYPMTASQQSPKVQRMARKIKQREARTIQACEYHPYYRIWR